MNFKYLFILVAAVFIFSCGEEEKSKPEDVSKAVENLEKNAGTNTELDAFLVDLEKVADEYCAKGKQFQSGSLSEKMAAAQSLMLVTSKMTEYNSRAVAFKASASPEATKRFQAVEAKMDGCQHYFEE